jgi:hypothetical protein
MTLTFSIVATRWQSRIFRKLIVSATMFAVTALLAMFADVFPQHAIGYIVIVGVLSLFNGFVLGVERLAISSPEPNDLLPFETLGVQRGT